MRSTIVSIVDLEDRERYRRCINAFCVLHYFCVRCLFILCSFPMAQARDSMKITKNKGESGLACLFMLLVECSLRKQVWSFWVKDGSIVSN